MFVMLAMITIDAELFNSQIIPLSLQYYSSFYGFYPRPDHATVTVYLITLMALETILASVWYHSNNQNTPESG